MRQRWPSRLWIVRHGQSAGNVARDLAHASGAEMIDIAMRDVDVPLSDLGHAQAAALGRWFAEATETERPQIVLSSPYLRARQTAEAVCAAAGFSCGAGGPILDERLREREFGILDRLTAAGIAARHPEQAEHRALLGKFYHRPPGGESWADVILRLRSALDSISLQHADCRVLIVAHEVVVYCMRYILERMDEATVLGISRSDSVLNCGLTEYDFPFSEDETCTPRLLRYNFAAPLEAEHMPITAEPDVIQGVR